MEKMKFILRVINLILSLTLIYTVVSCNRFKTKIEDQGFCGFFNYNINYIITNTSSNKMLEVTIKQISKCPDCNNKSKTFTIKLKPGEQTSLCGEEESIIDGKIKLNHCIYEVVGEREINN